jgi:Kef-type K+ transport system membrane component KefB
MLAARFLGMNWRESFSLGALMNTRGLVELIALNIGYDLGILPPQIFTMMVLMALATTFMAGPLLQLAGGGKRTGSNGETAALS